MQSTKALLAAFCLMAAITACSTAAPSKAPYDSRELPHGELGASIAYGRSIVVDTHNTMRGYVRARMSCEACHIDGGTKSRGGSFVGTYARFPQWNKRAGRVITLQDRLAECFLYSMNGRPPAYTSRAMVALVSYIAWLSRGVSTGSKQPPQDSFVEPLPQRAPNLVRGAALYAVRCARCHQAGGDGIGELIPPLWGAKSFNDGAGMAHLDRMAGFVRYNMPQDRPGSLSRDDSYDVAAFVLAHHRPHFHRNALVTQPARPAGFF